MKQTKRIMHPIFICILAISLLFTGIPYSSIVMKAKAENVKSGTVGDGLTWQYDSDGTLTISGNGSMPDYTTVNNYYTGITTDVPWEEYLADITKVVISGDVSNIGKCAFSDCNSIKQVSLSSSVKEIGESAFARCTGLNSISFPKALVSIGAKAFCGCTGITNLVIPDNVTTIGSGAFQACTNLTDIYLGKKVSSIKSDTFSSCKKLINIEIPQNIKSIESYAFALCSSLVEIDIPASVNSISDRVFEACSSLKKVTVNNDVLSYSYYQNVFANCSANLTLYANSGSTTETYAKENGHSFVSIGVANPSEPTATPNLSNPTATPASSTSTAIPGKITYYGMVQEEKSEQELVKEAANEFVKAENEYIGAMNSAIKLGANSTKEIEAIREEDRESKQPILTLTADAPDNAINAAYAGVVEFFREYRESIPDIGKIDISDNIVSIEAKIIKIIKTSFKDVNVRTKYGNYTVKINGILEWGAFACDVQVNGNGCACRGTLVSTVNETKSVMAAYIKSLGETGEDVFKQALKAYLKDFAKYSCISDFTSEKMNEALGNAADYLQSKGWGTKVLEYGVKLYEGYDLVDSIVKAKNETGLLNALSDAETLYNKVKLMSYTDASVKDKTVKFMIQKIEKNRKNFEDALWSYIYHSKSENGTLSFWDKVKGTYKKIIGHCPVDFVVYDDEGKVLGKAEDGYCEYDDSIYMEVSDDVKMIYVPNDIDARIEMIGTDKGVMSYVLEQYTNSVPSGRKNYYDIPLTDGCTYSQAISSGDISSLLSEDSLNAGTGSVINPNEYISVNDSALVNLSCVVSGQGNVTGTGKYVKGDAAELMAYPDDGYRFEGWYDGENLVGIEAIYRLVALNDKELKAVFQKANKTEQTINCEKSYSVFLGDEDFAINASAASNDLDYYSSDENVIEVDENGAVSIVGLGTAQIIIVARETEDYKEAVKTINITVSEKENPGKNENMESSFEDTEYSNLVRNHTPEAWGKCRTSFLKKMQGGGYQTAIYNQGKIYIKNFSDDFKEEFSKVIDLELPLWGGLFLGKSYNYVICGKAYDSEMDDGGEVYRIIKYSKEFERISSISLNGTETYTALPFDGGNVSAAEKGDDLIVYTSRLRPDGHQSNISIRINTEDMTVSDENGMVSFPDVHASHSFRQIVKYDDTEPVYVDLSDGFPQRSIYLQTKKIKKALLDIAGDIGLNITNAELSGLAISDTNYLVVGSYINHESNNIFLSSVDKESGEVNNQWLTNSTAFMPKYFHNPRIVKISKNKFIIMWGSLKTQYILVDGKGNIISELKETSAPITDCEPIYANGRVLCLSVEKGTMAFHEITDLSSNGIYEPEIGPLKSGDSWDGTVDVSWYDSAKTEFDISTAQQLAGFAQLVNNGNTFEGKEINLCQDIFLNSQSYSYTWTPIATYGGEDATAENIFQGMFLGNGHVIYNMKTDDGNAGGLFGCIGEKGRVKCVDISQGLLYSGGCIANINKGIISFCNNYSCTGASNLYAVGGICNDNTGLVYGCKNYGEVWGSCVAGIVGANSAYGATVSQCSNHGLVGGSGEVAGIVYINHGFISNCYNKGIVADGYIGNINRARCLCGLVYSNNNIMENCYSVGNFSYLEDGPWLGVYGGCRESDDADGIRNCYTLHVGDREEEGMEKISYEELQSPSFIARLDQQGYSTILSVWREDIDKINDGLPITVADESSYTGQCKIQPEVKSLRDGTVIDANLEDQEYSFEITGFYNESAPSVVVEDADIAEATVHIAEDKNTGIDGVSVIAKIQLKKVGSTQIKVHFDETENNSSVDYLLTLIIKNKMSEEPNTTVSPKPTWESDATASPKPTGKPDVTASPKPTCNTNISESPKPTNIPDTIQSPLAGTVLKDTATGMSYKVLVQGNSVAFCAVYSKTITKVIIPDSVTIDGINYKVTEISNKAFSGCKKLKSITISKYVAKIGDNAFNNCVSLKKVIIPASVTKIGKRAFYGCKKLKSITIKTKKLKNKSVGTQAFKGIHKKAVIKVPRKQKKAYKKWLRKKGIAKKMKIK